MSEASQRRVGGALCVWVDLLAGLWLLVAPVHLAATGVPGGTLVGVLLLFLGGYNHYRRRQTGHVEPIAAALGVLIGGWVLAVSLDLAPGGLLRRGTLLAGALVVIANGVGYRAGNGVSR